MEARKFRKKPVVIDAMRFETNNDDGSCLDEIVAWIKESGGDAFHDGTDLIIHTLEGDMRADVGDIIIKGVKGEFYPCKPDIFEKTYEIEPEFCGPPSDADSYRIYIAVTKGQHILEADNRNEADLIDRTNDPAKILGHMLPAITDRVARIEACVRRGAHPAVTGEHPVGKAPFPGKPVVGEIEAPVTDP